MNIIEFIKNYKKNELEKFAQQFADLLMLINFKVDQDVKIKSVFDFIMFFIEHGNQHSEMFEKLTKKEFDVAFKYLIIPIICSPHKLNTLVNQ